MDVFLTLLMSGASKNRRNGWETQIWFRRIPIRRKDQEDLHLPTAIASGLPVECDQFMADPSALGILDFHGYLYLFCPGVRPL